MKVKKRIGVRSDIYRIYFGTEIFDAHYDKEYPRIGNWTLHRYNQDASNPMFNMFFPVGGKVKFKDLSHIKKFIRDRKWL